MVRDVVDGKLRRPGYTIPGQVEDMVLQSAESGILAISGKAFVLGNNMLTPVPANDTVGWIDEIIDPNGSAIAAVRGQRGWGVVDRDSGDWLASTPGGSQLYAGEAGLVILDTSVNSSGITAYDFKGAKPTIARHSSDAWDADDEIVCVNVFGVMTYSEGRFTWNRSGRPR